jgi:hypothetical protein
MKPYFVIILLVLCVVVATILHATKLQQTDEISSFAKGIAPLQPYLHPNATTIGFKGEPSKSELLSWARFIAAPSYISPEPADTTLVIQYRSNSDPDMLNYMTSKLILKQVSDTQYTYSIVTRPNAK